MGIDAETVKPGAQAHVDGDGAKKKAGDDADQDGAQGEFGQNAFPKRCRAEILQAAQSNSRVLVAKRHLIAPKGHRRWRVAHYRAEVPICRREMARRNSRRTVPVRITDVCIRTPPRSNAFAAFE